jgi:hypothetical protein
MGRPGLEQGYVLKGSCQSQSAQLPRHCSSRMAGLIDGEGILLIGDLSERSVSGLDEGEGHHGVCLSSVFISINYSDTILRELQTRVLPQVITFQQICIQISSYTIIMIVYTTKIHVTSDCEHRIGMDVRYG